MLPSINRQIEKWLNDYKIDLHSRARKFGQRDVEAFAKVGRPYLELLAAREKKDNFRWSEGNLEVLRAAWKIAGPGCTL